MKDYHYAKRLKGKWYREILLFPGFWCLYHHYVKYLDRKRG